MPNIPYIITVPSDYDGEERSLIGKPLVFSASNASVMSGKIVADSENYNFVGSYYGTDIESSYVYKLDEEEKQFMKEVQLISMKPVLYCANIAEDDIKNPDIPYVNVVKEIAAKSDSEVVVISAKIEDELGQLEPEDREMFLEDLGIDSAGLDKMIKASYKLLGLISYLTAGPQEVRAWTIKEGTKAPQAAGKIHTDFERGFIRAEVVAYDDLIACGSMTAAKEKGLVRSEGKEYVMKDGDVVLFRFNV